MICPTTYQRLMALHLFVLNGESEVLAHRSEAIGRAKSEGLLTHFKTLKPEYAALLEDLADGVASITHNHRVE